MRAVIERMDQAAAAPDWHSLLQLNHQNRPKGNLYNAAVALRHAPELALAVRWNEFRLQTDVLSPLPWDAAAPRSWTNHDDLHLTEWLQGEGVGVGLDVAQQAVETVASEASHHPLRAWLEGLRWDRVGRLAQWLATHLGVERGEYAAAVGERWMISAVARVLRPGCKADHVLVLEGPQGKGKSTALRTLVGPEWFTDEIADLGGKDAAMQVRGVWVIELAELDHLSRQEVARIKAFLTRTTDRFRPPYGRRVVEAPRECVFAGTVNEAEYLRDETGNRRFWPVKVGTIDLDALATDREQLWAEAVHLYRKGRPWWLDTANLVEKAETEQAERLQDDAWLGKISDHVASLTRVTVADVLRHAIDKRIGDWRRVDEMRVASCLTRLGFVPRRAKTGRFYVRPEYEDNHDGG